MVRASGHLETNNQKTKPKLGSLRFLRLFMITLALGSCSFMQAAAQKMSQATSAHPKLLDEAQDNHQIYLPLVNKPCIANCYYVDSTNGSDANPGNSIDKPWRTLAPVNAKKFLPGDVVLFKSGSNWTGELVIDDSGEEGRPIIFTTYDGGNMPIITNPGTQDDLTHAVIINADWIIIDGFLLQNTSGAGVRITQTSSNDIVRNNEITNTGIGANVSGTRHLITHNYIHDLHIVRSTPGGNDDYGAIGIDLVDASDNEISYNRLVNCIAPSYDYGRDGGAIEWFGESDNNYIHHNWAKDNNGFFEVGGGRALNNLVSYNVSVNNGIFGFFNLTGDFATTVEDFRIENNTIVEIDSGGWVAIGFVGYPSTSTTILRNNIIYIDGIDKTVSLKPGFTHENNLYNLTGGAKLDFPLGPGDILADPLFANLANQDYHLQNGSLAIDAGLDLGHILDFENQPVPVGNAPDLGAYEH